MCIVLVYLITISDARYHEPKILKYSCLLLFTGVFLISHFVMLATEVILVLYLELKIGQ